MRAAAALIALSVLALTLGTGAAHAQTAGSYTPCEPVAPASLLQVSGASCAEARTLATALVAAPADAAPDVLKTAGWAPLRAQANDDGTAHDLVAIRGASALRIRRPGSGPDLDGWSAGRELIFARGTLVGGKPVPRGAALCTSAFLVRLPRGNLGGLSASHCGGTRKDGRIHRRNVALRRPPQPGIVLGRVRRNVERTQPLDALVLPIPSGRNRPVSAVIDRGLSNPPWRVAGTAQPTSGRMVCFSGRTSGTDQCGQIVGRGARRAERVLSIFAGLLVRCTTITAREGDSGGPVYTAPAPDGTVRAVGITTLVVGRKSRMCFTPLGPVLRTLGASVITNTPA
jgi:hypothetical protein